MKNTTPRTPPQLNTLGNALIYTTKLSDKNPTKKMISLLQDLVKGESQVIYKHRRLQISTVLISYAAALTKNKDNNILYVVPNREMMRCTENLFQKLELSKNDNARLVPYYNNLINEESFKPTHLIFDEVSQYGNEDMLHKIFGTGMTLKQIVTAISIPEFEFPTNYQLITKD